MRFFSFLIAAVALTQAAAGSGDLRFASGAQQVSLIELFTSEGCSSCPPADRWLGSLRTDPGLWRDYVPVEFHVNYWDQLGWKDRLSSRVFTERQYALARQWGSGSVYTPCFVRDGAEWHPDARPPQGAADRAGVLEVEIRGETCRVRWASPGAASAFDVHAAILGGGLVSRVTAGENRGSSLEHEFVALGLVDRPLDHSESGVLGTEFLLPSPSVPHSPRRALAVWVTRHNQLRSLQATGGWLNPEL